EKTGLGENLSLERCVFRSSKHKNLLFLNGLTTTKQEVLLFHPIPKLRDESCFKDNTLEFHPALYFLFGELFVAPAYKLAFGGWVVMHKPLLQNGFSSRV